MVLPALAGPARQSFMLTGVSEVIRGLVFGEKNYIIAISAQRFIIRP